MADELENGLRCIAALTQLHRYIDDKDLGGDTSLRVDVWRPSNTTPASNTVLPARVKFVFEFPVEYETMCKEVYYPEALRFAEDVEGVEIYMMPEIEAINRYNAGDEDDIKVGFVFMMPENWWRKASQHTIRVVGESFSRGIFDNIIVPINDIAQDVFKLMYDFVGVINETSLSLGMWMSDDTNDPNYRPVRDWSKQFKEEVTDGDKNT